MLKAKSTGFKPKAKPRPNAQPQTATPSSSTQASVERQTETPTALSQPAVPTVTSTASNKDQRSAVVNNATHVPQPQAPITQTPATSIREERQSVVQPTPATTSIQKGIAKSVSTPISTTNPLKTTSVTATAATTSPEVSQRPALTSQAISVNPTPHPHPSTSTTAPLPTPPASALPSTPQETGGVQSKARSKPLATAASRADKAASRPAASSGETEAGPSRPAKRRKTATTTQEDVRPSIEDEDSQTENPKPKRSRKPRDPNAPKRKRKRRSTPEDAESEVIDRASTKMSDLTKDLGIGRNFSMREKIMERELERKEKARIAKEKEMLEDSDMSNDEGEDGQDEGNAENADNADNATPAEADARSASANAAGAVAAAVGPRIRVVNGNIILDESSLQVDRHRLAAEAEEEMAFVEEDDFTRIVTSGTNQKREKNTRWGDADTEKFYDGLRMFGTDFGMIAKTFGKKRTRRQIKLKFNKEEREDPDRVTRCLTGVKDREETMDLGKFKNSSKMEDPAAVEAEIEALENSYKAAKEQEAEEQREADREKRAIIAAGRGGAAARESSKENETGTAATAQKGGASAASKGKKKAPAKKTKRQKIQHLGGEEFEVLGTIDD